MNIEHRRYTGPLRWDVCAECKEPWPCGPAVFRCELDTITAELTTQCTAERPFGPCTQRCEQPAGHDGPHRSQCFAWCNPHDIATDIANLWSGPKDLWNTADGGQTIGQMVTRYCRQCPWMEEHMCAFGEDGHCDHTEGWTEK